MHRYSDAGARRGRLALLAGLALGLTALAPRPAAANGRFPGTSSINFKLGDDSQIVAGMTFGALVSKDSGATWYWVCEDAIGYGGTYDPDYVFTASGSLFATTFDGLRIRRDQCVFGESPVQGEFVTTVTAGPDGAIYFGSVAGDRKIYKSTDDGMTVPLATTPGVAGTWWQSIEVAPSDPNRIYLTGHRPGPGGTGTVLVLFRSSDGGENWTPLPVTAFAVMQTSTLEIVGISRVNPSIVFARISREDGLASSSIYRSTDSGQNWTKIHASPEQISFLVRANGELVAGTLGRGSVRSTDGGNSFQPLASPPHITCLSENSAGEVWACTVNTASPTSPVSDNYGIMKSTDLATWTPVLRYQEIKAPVDCPAGTVQRDTCDELWCGFCAQVGCDPKRSCPNVGGDTSDSTDGGGGGCCRTSGGGAAGHAVLGCFAAIFLARRRSGRSERSGRSGRSDRSDRGSAAS